MADQIHMASDESSASDTAYLAIRDALVTGEYKPGELLSEQQLADAVGVSRTPVRRALSLLAVDGLVRLIPGRGAIVDEMTPRMIAELCVLRELLETHAIHAARPSRERLEIFDAFFLAAMELGDEERNPAFFTMVDTAIDELHATFVRALGSSIIDEVFDRIRLRALRSRILAWSASDVLPSHRGAIARASDHQQIVAAHLSGDVDRASDLVVSCLRAGRDAATEALMQAPPTVLHRPSAAGARFVVDLLAGGPRTQDEVLDLIKQTLAHDSE